MFPEVYQICRILLLPVLSAISQMFPKSPYASRHTKIQKVGPWCSRNSHSAGISPSQHTIDPPMSRPGSGKVLFCSGRDVTDPSTALLPARHTPPPAPPPAPLLPSHHHFSRAEAPKCPNLCCPLVAGMKNITALQGLCLQFKRFFSHQFFFLGFPFFPFFAFTFEKLQQY